MRTVEWLNGRVRMIDQRHIPWTLTYVELDDFREVAQAIAGAVVRGPSAIGAAGAYGIALAAQQSPAPDMGSLVEYLEVAEVILKKAQPTNPTLVWAIDRLMLAAHAGTYRNVAEMRLALLAEAQQIADEDVQLNQQLGKHGATLIRSGDVILHHCDAAALTTVDYGMALGVIRTAHEEKKNVRTLLTETRPRMLGARLTAWELDHIGVPFEIIADSAAGYYMRRGEVNLVLVGAERIAANGDTANTIGTYTLAVLAKENNIPFYVVAATGTIDLTIKTGDDIEIEERGPDEMRTPFGDNLIPERFQVRNPGMDITPQRYLAGIVTEHGIIMPPFRDNLPRAVQRSGGPNLP